VLYRWAKRAAADYSHLASHASQAQTCRAHL